jgi:hypothetical protein
METILNYLDNMFVNLPGTPQVKRAKEELASMMEDKYNELIAQGKKENEAIGIVISEFGNIQELAQELGIEDTVTPGGQGEYSSESMSREVSREEAEEYIETVKKTTPKIAVGVMMCIFSPIVLLLLGGISEYKGGISEGAAAGTGICVLLVMVAFAVGIFIYFGSKVSRFEYMKKELVHIDSFYAKQIRERLQYEQLQGNVKLIVGIVLCILSVIPLIIFGCQKESPQQEFLCVMGVCFLLIVVGIGVYLIICSSGAKECYEVLLQEGEFTPKSKKTSKVMEKVASIYWSLITFVYLAWSFYSMKWGFTWIVWPIAGVLYGLIATIGSVFEDK